MTSITKSSSTYDASSLCAKIDEASKFCIEYLDDDGGLIEEEESHRSGDYRPEARS